MKRLVHFVRLAPRDRTLAIQAAIAMALCQMRLRFQDVQGLQNWATRQGRGSYGVMELVNAVERASRVVPRSTCLVRAIVLQRLLSMNGHDSELKIGVGRSSGQFVAHAWLVQGERIVIGQVANSASYSPLSSWSGVKKQGSRRESAQ